MSMHKDMDELLPCTMHHAPCTQQLNTDLETDRGAGL